MIPRNDDLARHGYIALDAMVQGWWARWTRKQARPRDPIISELATIAAGSEPRQPSRDLVSRLAELGFDDDAISPRDARSWIDVMHAGMDCAGEGNAPITDNQYNNFLFFWMFVILGAYFVTNIFVGVMVNFFSESSGTGLLTHAQKQWQMKQLVLILYFP